MNLKNLFQDFNPSKFLVFLCLLLFSLFYALQLDGTIQWSYWLVFLPIWLWKLVVMSGAAVGSYVWWKNPQYRGDGDSYVQYKAMIITSGMHLLLLMFELLACDKLESGRHKWTLVFIPLMFMSVTSIGICVWAVKHERSFELELFSAVNILQFIFLALKFDGIVQWSFVIVFIPVWIVMCVALIGVLYAVILAIILMKSPDIVAEQRRGNLSTAVAYTFLVLPLLVFEILLSNRLDGDQQFPYIAIAVPLFISLITLICMAFTAKGGNQWWFGLRKDFCQFLLNACPLLQEYGNIAYSIHNNNTNATPESQREVRKSESKHSRKELVEEQPRIVVPVISIETPD